MRPSPSSFWRPRMTSWLSSWDLEILHGEAGHGQGDPQPFGGGLLDVVGGVALGVLLHPVEHLLEMVEAEEQRRSEDGRTGHGLVPPRG